MMDDGKRLADAARSLVGTPYRLHGHDPAHGLDCIGLLIASLGMIGRELAVPKTYRLRNRTIEPLLELARREDVEEVTGPQQEGDALIVRPGPAQQHVLIALGRTGFVHAHASLRRVVSFPGPTPWPILRQWRLISANG